MPAAKLRVIAERSACCGYGVCVEICPQIYKLDSLGIVTLLAEEVPPGLEESAREGAAACPTSALRVVEEPA